MAGVAVIPQEKCQSCELVSTWNYFEWYYEDTFLQFFLHTSHLKINTNRYYGHRCWITFLCSLNFDMLIVFTCRDL